MQASNGSPRSRIKKSILTHYRARGRRVNNLWLVYSPKTDQDWVLPSDRQLIHWIHFLETNPNVKSFNLQPEPIISSDEKETRATELDAIVETIDGKLEWHEVKAGKSTNDPMYESQKQAQTRAASLHRAIYRRFDDVDLKPVMRVSIRWLKAIAYAAAIRDKEHIPTLSSLILVLQSLKEGSVKDLLVNLSEYDPAVVCGLIVRLALKGQIQIDLSNRPFGNNSHWAISD